MSQDKKVIALDVEVDGGDGRYPNMFELMVQRGHLDEAQLGQPLDEDALSFATKRMKEFIKKHEIMIITPTTRLGEKKESFIEQMFRSRQRQTDEAFYFDSRVGVESKSDLSVYMAIQKSRRNSVIGKDGKPLTADVFKETLYMSGFKNGKSMTVQEFLDHVDVVETPKPVPKVKPLKPNQNYLKLRKSKW